MLRVEGPSEQEDGGREQEQGGAIRTGDEQEQDDE